MPDEHRIRQRAYEIWEGEGRPEGRHEEHWVRARRELGGSDTESGSPEDAPTVTAPGTGGSTPGEAAAAAAAVGTPRKAEPQR